MADQNANLMDILCTALDMKDKMRELYEKALAACPDAIGRQTFEMLAQSEKENVEQLRRAQEDVKGGNADSCRFVPENEDIKKKIRAIAAAQGLDHQICADDVHALETGLKLEQEAVRFFEDKLAQASDDAEKRILENLVAEEREHHSVLADLKYYFTDPKGWFMEKADVVLDGA